LDLDKREVSLYAGTGREARNDGKRLGEFEDAGAATFAQPSGLAFGDSTLYVADSESNIVRAIAGEEVRTLAGGDLFEFGDRDGEGDAVRFQHPLGLALVGGRLFVADTYNHRLKVLDPRSGRVSTFAGTGRPGQTDGARPQFYEPGGLSAAGGKLYVADTNNHAVRVVDLATKQTKTLVIGGLKPPEAAAAPAEEAESAGPKAEETKAAPQRLAATDGAQTLVIDVALPDGYHVNPSAPQRCRVEVTAGGEHLSLSAPAGGVSGAPGVSSVTSKDVGLPVRMMVHALKPGAAELRVRLTLYYCREDNTGTCRIKTLAWRVPVELSAEPSAPREVFVRGEIRQPEGERE
jgi:sugar lactone lactonase YvrE